MVSVAHEPIKRVPVHAIRALGRLIKLHRIPRIEDIVLIGLPSPADLIQRHPDVNNRRDRQSVTRLPGNLQKQMRSSEHHIEPHFGVLCYDRHACGNTSMSTNRTLRGPV